MSKVTLTLPHPPSINNYYKRRRGGGVYIGEAGLRFRSRVWQVVMERGQKNEWASPSLPLKGPLRVHIDWYPPDKRRRDTDNIRKALFDAMEEAHVFIDDSQIVDDRVIKRDPEKPGRVEVTLEEVC